MATVVLSALVSHIKGSLGGSTFQRSASGLTMRNKPIPVGRGTNAQFAQRNIIAQLNYAWNNLNDTVRAAWSSYAVYANGSGKTNKQNNSANTGKTQFFAVNSWLLIYGKALISVPTFTTPVSQSVPCPPFFSKSSNLGTTTGSLDTSHQLLVVQVSLPQSASTISANTGFRTLVFDQVNGTTQDWSSAYLSTFGVPLTLGKKYWIQLLVVDFITGAISPKARALVLYTAVTPLGIGSAAIGSTLIIG